jgi:hypothetical protein
MNKETAVEWIKNEIQEALKDYGGLDLEWLKRFEQAKEMEKQQIIEANDRGWKVRRSGIDETAEQYYREKFNNKKNNK